MMIDIDKRSSNQLNLVKKKLKKISLLSNYNKSTSPQYSESFMNISRTEIDSFNKDFSKQSSIYSNDRFDSLSNITQRTQLSNLLSLDFIQSSASFIYPNIRIISSGYFTNEKNSIYVFSNTLSSNKNIPLVYLGNEIFMFVIRLFLSKIGSEYFLRKSIDFERLKFPISTIENIEPLIDLFLNRPQFLKEIPELNDLSNYRFLPQSISGLIFFDSSTRHLCSELRTKQFTIEDLLHMSQRENNIIQINALNDKRYQALKDQLTDIYSYQNSSSLDKEKQSKLNVLEEITRTISYPSIEKYSRIKTRPTIVTSILS
jgi:hypothetical protein